MTNGEFLVPAGQMLPFHPISNLFPLIDGADFDALIQDIKTNGLHEPIWLHSDDNSIIDGRNRYRACIAAGVTPRFRRWSDNGGLVQFVLSLNLHRRHLTSSQRAALAVEILPILEAEAKERRKQTEGRPSKLSQKIDAVSDAARNDGRATAQAATLTGSNRQYVSDMKTLHSEAPALFAAVREGEKTVAQAKREHKKQTVAKAPPLPSNKYRVIYADPPWSYGNSGVINDSDGYGRAERHYPCMSIDELCAMGKEIKAVCEANAVMFMWVTSPLLAECFPVITAWGFQYKTSFVWDKVVHNFGHYNSVRHELLLVCTRGSCTPDTSKLYDSVINIEKSRKHSEKPKEFREMIDSLYTHGRRLELFARISADGWDTWGNEK